MPLFMVKSAWEMEVGGKTILICVPGMGGVSYEWACRFADLWTNRPPGTERLQLGPYVVDQAREDGCTYALQNGFKWIFFLDNDVLPPADIVQRLLQREKDVVSGLYIRRHQPLYPYLLKKTSENPIQFGLITGWKAGDLVEVDACPAGCMLVSTAVLRQIPQPWFLWTANRAPDGVSEDYFFTLKARKFGFRTFVDTAIKCKHEGRFDLVPQDDGGYSFEVVPPNP